MIGIVLVLALLAAGAYTGNAGFFWAALVLGVLFFLL